MRSSCQRGEDPAYPLSRPAAIPLSPGQWHRRRTIVQAVAAGFTIRRAANIVAPRRLLQVSCSVCIEFANLLDNSVAIGLNQVSSPTQARWQAARLRASFSPYEAASALFASQSESLRVAGSAFYLGEDVRRWIGHASSIALLPVPASE